MSSKTLLRFFALLFAAFSFYSVRLAAQDDAPSVAEAARRTRQQKQEAAKPAHVIDNDSLPPSPTPANPSISSTSAKESDSAAIPENPPASPQDEEQAKKEIDNLKQQIAEKKSQIDLQQRQLTLAQDSYFSNPNHEDDKSGQDKINSMQSDLDQAKSDLVDLQAKLDKLASSSPTVEPANSKPSESTPAKP